MFGKIVFLLLPVVLKATQVCDGNACSMGIDTRIAGGESSEPNTRPFQVALYLRLGRAGELNFCGGALVHLEWVLTAAHCCFQNGLQVDYVQAILGAHSLYDRYENGRRIVNVAEIVIHPSWDPESFANDIALLRLANTIQLTDTINVVRLPYLSISSFNFAGMAAVASGWGIAAEGVTFVSPTLRERLMTVMTDTFCNATFFNQLPDNMICGFSQNAGTCKDSRQADGPLRIWQLPSPMGISDIANTLLSHKGTGTWVTNAGTQHKVIMAAYLRPKVVAIQTGSPAAEGDNGGPMTIFYNATEETILVGVTSFISTTGCNDELPSVFTRVQRYLSWISEITGLELI